MKSRRAIVRVLVVCIAAVALWFVGGFAFTPTIDLEKHKPIGDLLWSRIEAYAQAGEGFPGSEEELLESDIFSKEERRLFLDRSFGHRKFLYVIDERMGPSLLLEHMPGTLLSATVWHQSTNAEPDAAPEPPPADAMRVSPETLNPKPESEAPAASGGR